MGDPGGTGTGTGTDGGTVTVGGKRVRDGCEVMSRVGMAWADGLEEAATAGSKPVALSLPKDPRRALTEMITAGQ